MTMALNEDQTMLAQTASSFMRENSPITRFRALRDSGEERGYSLDIYQQMAELGWTAIPFSKDDGGFGGGPVELMVMMLRFGKGLVVEPYLANIVLAGGVLRRAADADQKARWLLPIVAGELQAALAFVEPQSRYDIKNVTTTAAADGDGWILNGRKGVVLNGGNAALLIVPARTAGDQYAKDGITLFAVAADCDGITRKSYPTVDGQQAAEIGRAHV